MKSDDMLIEEELKSQLREETRKQKQQNKSLKEDTAIVDIFLEEDDVSFEQIFKRMNGVKQEHLGNQNEGFDDTESPKTTKSIASGLDNAYFNKMLVRLEKVIKDMKCFQYHTFVFQVFLALSSIC